MSYRPIIVINGKEPEDVSVLERQAADFGITHVRALNGKVWKTYSWLNRKSVPLNHLGGGPSRLPWSQVESLGVQEADQ